MGRASRGPIRVFGEALFVFMAAALCSAQEAGGTQNVDLGRDPSSVGTVISLLAPPAKLKPLQKSGLMTPAQLEARIKSYADSGRLADYDLPTFDEANERIDIIYLKQCVRLAQVKYGKELRGLVINPYSIDPSFVNLVFFGDDPDDLFYDFRGNCAYTGYKNLIVCDIHFLHELTGTRPEDRPSQGTLSTGEDLDAMLMATRAFTALWVLGHEIGHLAHGHKSRHFLFRDEPSDVLIHNPDGRPKGASYVSEQEADEFAFDVIRQSPAPSGLGTFLWMGLSETVFRLANDQLRKQGERSDTVKGIENRTYRLKIESQTHPPTFLRAVAIALQLAEGLQLDKTGHFRRIYEHMELH